MHVVRRDSFWAAHLKGGSRQGKGLCWGGVSCTLLGSGGVSRPAAWPLDMVFIMGGKKNSSGQVPAECSWISWEWRNHRDVLNKSWDNTAVFDDMPELRVYQDWERHVTSDQRVCVCTSNHGRTIQGSQKSKHTQEYPAKSRMDKENLFPHSDNKEVCAGVPFLGECCCPGNGQHATQSHVTSSHRC